MHSSQISHSTFKTMNKRLLILLLFIMPTGLAFAQTAVKGVIKRTDGTPVPRATITVRGTGIGVVADDSGRFVIDARQEPPFYLQVTSVGYKPQDFQVLKFQDTPLELILVEDNQLTEIVVTSKRHKKKLQDGPGAGAGGGGARGGRAGAGGGSRGGGRGPARQL